MNQNAVLFGGLTLGVCLDFYAVGYFSIPKEHRNRFADVLPWVAVLAFAAVVFAGTSAWLAYDGGKGSVVVLIAAGAVTASSGQIAVRRRFDRRWCRNREQRSDGSEATIAE